MIAQLGILKKVKGLREERTLRALRAKQAEVADAQASETRQRDLIRQSAEDLPGKIKAIYDQIMGQVVGLTDIDATKEHVRAAREAHQALEDELERRIQIRLRLETELKDARRAYQTAQRETEKFSTLESDMRSEVARREEALAEIEIEELFSKGQALPA